MKQLTVYKASAGSGKTFTLAVEYIKLLIKNPMSFKNILAVTFTNKATEEMKMRILSQLYGIWKKLPDSRLYMKEITEKLNISEEQASKQAGIALNRLVHNYNYFKVETIDSFFQSVLRNLARELDLTANLKIGLNDSQVEEEAIDELIESLTATSILLQWLINYIFTNIEENRGWNVIGQIKSFGKNIFQDYYKSISNDLNKAISKEFFFDKYIKQIKDIRNNAEKRMISYADTFVSETVNAGLDPYTSFASKGKGICSYFKKLKTNDFSDDKCINNTLKKCLDNAENWTTKNSPERNTIIALVNKSLMKLLHDAEKERSEQWKLYSTAEVTLKHLSKLRLLNTIEIKVRELNENANRFLLSDTQYLLHSLIKENDSPFIFEKAGCQLEHIMIDEFQDTSSVQWQNFKVLLKECMSHSSADDNTVHNLIVGDVKQSIYRWRAGDWRLLNNIKDQFPFSKEQVEICSLQTNYRSEKNIIDFNNAFFTLAAKYEYENGQDIGLDNNANEIIAAYRDVCQKARQEKKQTGYVKLVLLPNEEYNDAMLKNIEDCIDEIRLSGMPLNKTAILFRYNKLIPVVADYFMEKRSDLTFVSDEAFRLDASSAVNTIILALQLLLHPDDTMSKANLAVIYQNTVLKKNLNISDILTNFNTDTSTADSFLPQNFIDNIKTLTRKPLFDIIEFIYTSFGLERIDEQGAYICAFYDQVSDFINNNSGNIDKFINEWNENIHSKTIQCDEIDGIRLISIHKSKGLEYDNVIIPFCDWTLENRNTTLWCNPKENPFNQLPIVPVDYNKKLLNTIYAEDYKNEYLQNTVDNLNLLYVAFTRACKNLFIIGKKNNSSKGVRNRSEILNNTIEDLAEILPKSTLSGIDEDNSPTIFEYGCFYCDEATKSTQTQNVFVQPASPFKVNMGVSNYVAEFRQSNKSNDFIKSEDEEDERSQYIKIGNVLHKLFSMIRTTDDIDNVLKQFEFDGVLYDDNITAEKMRNMLSQRLADKQVSDWFDRRWTIFNECSILEYDKTLNKVVERRPDRVITDGKIIKVIDFKFGKPCNKYKNQVKQYMSLLKSMGYQNIEGYLWFVYSNKIDKVE